MVELCSRIEPLCGCCKGIQSGCLGTGVLCALLRLIAFMVPGTHAGDISCCHDLRVPCVCNRHTSASARVAGLGELLHNHRCILSLGLYVRCGWGVGGHHLTNDCLALCKLLLSETFRDRQRPAGRRTSTTVRLDGLRNSLWLFVSDISRCERLGRLVATMDELVVNSFHP